MTPKKANKSTPKTTQRISENDNIVRVYETDDIAIQELKAKMNYIYQVLLANEKRLQQLKIQSRNTHPLASSSTPIEADPYDAHGCPKYKA